MIIMKEKQEAAEKRKNRSGEWPADASATWATGGVKEGAQNFQHFGDVEDAMMFAQDNSGLESKHVQQQLVRIERDDRLMKKAQFAFVGLGVKGLQHVIPKLMVNHYLTFIDLGGNALGDGGVMMLSEYVEATTSLVELQLFRNSIGPRGMTRLADALANNRTVQRLNLGSNHIGDSGCKALAMTLQTNEALAYVWLGYNAVGDLGVQALLHAVEGYNETMVYLDLDGNNVSPRVKHRLGNCLADNKAYQMAVKAQTVGVADVQVVERQAAPQHAQQPSPQVSPALSSARLSPPQPPIQARGSIERSASTIAVHVSQEESVTDPFRATSSSAHAMVMADLVDLGDSLEATELFLSRHGQELLALHDNTERALGVEGKDVYKELAGRRQALQEVLLRERLTQLSLRERMFIVEDAALREYYYCLVTFFIDMFYSCQIIYKTITEEDAAAAAAGELSDTDSDDELDTFHRIVYEIRSVEERLPSAIIVRETYQNTTKDWGVRQQRIALKFCALFFKTRADMHLVGDCFARAVTLAHRNVVRSIFHDEADASRTSRNRHQWFVNTVVEDEDLPSTDVTPTLKFLAAEHAGCLLSTVMRGGLAARPSDSWEDVEPLVRVVLESDETSGKDLASPHAPGVEGDEDEAAFRKRLRFKEVKKRRKSKKGKTVKEGKNGKKQGKRKKGQGAGKVEAKGKSQPTSSCCVVM